MEGDDIYMVNTAVTLVRQAHRVRSALDVVSSDPDHVVRVGTCDEALGELNPALQLQGVVVLQIYNSWDVTGDQTTPLQPGKTDRQLDL